MKGSTLLQILVQWQEPIGSHTTNRVYMQQCRSCSRH